MSTPKGLKIFRQFFADFVGQYVLIGGTANFLALEAAGLDARATKDLDIVLLAEGLTPEFGHAFWQFIDKGGYALQQEGMAARKLAGEAIDEKNIRKHFNDVLRLSRILPVDAHVDLPDSVKADVMRFISEAQLQPDHVASLKLGANVNLASILDDLKLVFG